MKTDIFGTYREYATAFNVNKAGFWRLKYSWLELMRVIERDGYTATNTASVKALTSELRVLESESRVLSKSRFANISSAASVVY